MTELSVSPVEILTLGYIPLEYCQSTDRRGIQDNHGGHDDQNGLQLCDWKYASVKRQSTASRFVSSLEFISFILDGVSMMTHMVNFVAVVANVKNNWKK